MRNSLFFAIVFVLFGCGTLQGDPGLQGPRGPAGEVGAPGPVGPQGPPGEAATVSGTRLRARYMTGVDGSKEFAGWYDNQLSANCTIDLAADGQMRCIPDGPGSAIAWADAACTMPVVQQNKNCTMPPFVLHKSVDSCGVPTGIRVFEVGAQLPQQPTVYSFDCSAPEQVSGPPWFSLVEIPPMSMVAVTQTIE